tara:strand:+ start:263 stop:661 length:399 start_codon:yes stop_codon:yes gene_type:complete
MPNSYKIFEKCRDTKCGDLYTKKELNNSKKEFHKDLKKECNKIKDNTKYYKCYVNELKKSKYNKLLQKRKKCVKKNCKKEQEKFTKEFIKKIKEYKRISKKNMKSKSNKKTKKKSNKKPKKKNSKKSVYNKK